MALAKGPPSRWLLALALCAVVLTGLSVLAAPAVRIYESYQDTRNDEALRPFKRFYDLTRVARMAARSSSPSGAERGRYAADELARTYEAFRLDWNYGNAIHYYHLALGRSALHAGDLETAKCHLLEAGRTPGSPQLNDYGPDMTLAQEMIERGELATVQKYFSECEKFWLNRQNNRLSEWSSAVRAGLPPDFGWSSGLSWPRDIR